MKLRIQGHLSEIHFSARIQPSTIYFSIRWKQFPFLRKAKRYGARFLFLFSSLNNLSINISPYNLFLVYSAKYYSHYRLILSWERMPILSCIISLSCVCIKGLYCRRTISLKYNVFCTLLAQKGWGREISKTHLHVKPRLKEEAELEIERLDDQKRGRVRRRKIFSRLACVGRTTKAVCHNTKRAKDNQRN